MNDDREATDYTKILAVERALQEKKLSAHDWAEGQIHQQNASG